jgi:S-(hydroxymethyl)glutathione dehydrogenase / alcohol dehydrogenase
MYRIIGPVVGAGRPGETVEIPAYELFHDDKPLTGSFSMHRVNCL